jgi:hypothetical protein
MDEGEECSGASDTILPTTVYLHNDPTLSTYFFSQPKSAPFPLTKAITQQPYLWPPSDIPEFLADTPLFYQKLLGLPVLNQSSLWMTQAVNLNDRSTQQHASCIKADLTKFTTTKPLASSKDGTFKKHILRRQSKITNLFIGLIGVVYIIFRSRCTF